jgi:hypothetical protein
MKSLITIIFLTAIFTVSVKSQIEISEISEINKIKTGTTYIALKGLFAKEMQEYLNAIQSSWTISKYEVINHSEIEKYLSPENSFLTIENITSSVYESKTDMIYPKGKYSNKPQNSTQMNYAGSNTQFYLELWTCKAKVFKKRKLTKPRPKDMISIAKIGLFTDLGAANNPEYIYQPEFYGLGHIRNWGPGILKNYIQTLMTCLDKNETRNRSIEFANLQELKNLKKEVLYVPDYILINSEGQMHDLGELFKDYNLKYEIIPTQELNKKILTENTRFYYLIYIMSGNKKFVNIMNSNNGEIVYSKCSVRLLNINSGDFKDLQQEIQSD